MPDVQADVCSNQRCLPMPQSTCTKGNDTAKSFDNHDVLLMDVSERIYQMEIAEKFAHRISHRQVTQKRQRFSFR